MQALSASRIFTGHEWLKDQVILISNGRIEAIVPRLQLKPDTNVRTLAEGFLAPAFVDAQVYGAGGKLFSLYPEAATLARMQEIFSAEGTACFLPTAATNTIDQFKKCIDAVRDYWQKGGAGVPGLHLEGPWLNPEKRGAHVKEWIHAPGLSEVEDLLNYGKGIIKVITVAPEVCAPEVTDFILKQGIILSAGHSAASYEQAIECFDAGIANVTHLYNAMSPLQHRAPGLVGAAMHHPHARASIIPDGHHVDFAAVSIAKKIMGPRLFAITDAVTETSAGPYQHQLAGDKYEANGILSGSALSMHKALLNLVAKCEVEPAEALRMCSLYPAEATGCAADYGQIMPGAKAAFVWLGDGLELREAITF